jgi:23S rRNA (uridine2552-2'-O)-methyltransferase
MKKTKSSRRWLQEHFNDTYVKQAKQLGYRSRAVFKILELQERDKLFKQGMTVVDLGAAPGSWAQVVVKMVGKNGRVIALDILPMEPIPGVDFILGDFTEDSALHDLHTCLGDSRVDWVISDMAPNISGVDSVDQPRSIELAELALDLAIQVLGEDGGFLTKMFQGEGFDAYLVAVRQNFKKVVIRKPKASRDRSREVYILARN